MRQPFWIVNSTLLLLAIATLGFIYFSTPSISSRKKIEPAPIRTPSAHHTSAINLDKIYEYDLFDTYQRELIPQASPEHVALAPTPPYPVPVHVPEEPKPQFIEPLPITLKGIVVVLNDDSKNRATIMDNRTSKEASYKVGDTIEDAQLIHIFSNKIILVRSNGQQEVLYLREQDAKMDSSYSQGDPWDTLITQTAANTFTINVQEFVHRVQSLGQFIDLLEITTAYHAGQSIGARAHNTNPGSLGAALGLTNEDIVTAINGISTATTNNRLDIYKMITQTPTPTPITATILRNNQELTHTYILENVQAAPKQEIGNLPSHRQEQKKQVDHNAFAPTLQEMRTREKTNILQNGKRPTRNVLSNLTE